jgi:hypothetical protein
LVVSANRSVSHGKVHTVPEHVRGDTDVSGAREEAVDLLAS